MWVCHVCQVGGKVYDAHTIPVYFGEKPRVDRPTLRVPALFPLGTEHLHELRNLEKRKHPTRKSAIEGLMASPLHDIVVPLYLDDAEDPCGYHSWNPASSPAYRTIGSRGLAIREKRWEKILLFEGLFDWSHATYWAWRLGYDYTTIFTAGNTLSSSQLGYLLRLIWAHRTREVVVCFDNDKLAPIQELKNQLSWFADVMDGTPPPHRGKDWDEVLRIGGKDYLDVLLGGE